MRQMPNLKWKIYIAKKKLCWTITILLVNQPLNVSEFA